MTKHRTKFEQLLNWADEYDLLARLSPDPEIKARSAKLAAEYRKRAADLVDNSELNKQAS